MKALIATWMFHNVTKTTNEYKVCHFLFSLLLYKRNKTLWNILELENNQLLLHTHVFYSLFALSYNTFKDE